MEKFESALQNVDKEKIKNAVKLHAPIQITTYTLPRNMELYMHEVLTVFLKECHYDNFSEYLNFCLGELLTNSKKANTKRVFFAENNLDINDPKDYAKGMSIFREKTFGNIDHYLTEQKKAGLYVKLILQALDDKINIEIRNNSRLCKFEEKRIQEKLNSVKQYNNEKDVINKVLDQTEGAGLGIIIMILMLQKIGLSKENYKIFVKNDETVTRIEIPLNQKMTLDVFSLYDVFIKNQTTIPVIDENLKQLNKLLSAKNPDSSQIIDFISRDVTLSFILFKNSVKIDNTICCVSKAFELLGIERIKKIYNPENQEIRLISRKNDTNNYWKHSYSVAFYAYNLAKQFGLDKDFSLEDIYFCALLHDIQCIFIQNASEEQKKAVEKSCIEYNFDQTVQQSFFENEMHSKGGAKFLNQLNFPKNLCNAVDFHNNPDTAPEEIAKIIAVIYLADVYQYYEKNIIDYCQVNEAVLKLFNIDSEEKFLMISKVLYSQIKKQQNF
ncbi:MAG: HDOD domain-containing protein [Treponema sp.]|nr:HDOD domain-containing protein [Treponema sp.]